MKKYARISSSPIGSDDDEAVSRSINENLQAFLTRNKIRTYTILNGEMLYDPAHATIMKHCVHISYAE